MISGYIYSGLKLCHKLAMLLIGNTGAECGKHFSNHRRKICDKCQHNYTFILYLLYFPPKKFVICLEMGECCVDQCEMYKRFGQRFGLSPEAYWAKAANYSSVNRRLNLIRVFYCQHKVHSPQIRNYTIIGYCNTARVEVLTKNNVFFNA